MQVEDSQTQQVVVLNNTTLGNLFKKWVEGVVEEVKSETQLKEAQTKLGNAKKNCARTADELLINLVSNNRWKDKTEITKDDKHMLKSVIINELSRSEETEETKSKDKLVKLTHSIHFFSVNYHIGVMAEKFKQIRESQQASTMSTNDVESQLKKIIIMPATIHDLTDEDNAAEISYVTISKDRIFQEYFGGSQKLVNQRFVNFAKSLSKTKQQIFPPTSRELKLAELHSALYLESNKSNGNLRTKYGITEEVIVGMLKGVIIRIDDLYVFSDDKKFISRNNLFNNCDDQMSFLFHDAIVTNLSTDYQYVDSTDVKRSNLKVSSTGIVSPKFFIQSKQYLVVDCSDSTKFGSFKDLVERTIGSLRHQIQIDMTNKKKFANTQELPPKSERKKKKKR